MKNLAAFLPLVLATCAAPAPPPSDKAVGKPNPASVHCTQQGGTIEIRKSPEGETGYCHLPDGRVIEEWELFRAQRKDQGA